MSPSARLHLLARLLEGRTRLAAVELEAVVLPKDEASFDALLVQRGAAIDELLGQGRDLVERAERIVCRLYALPQELEDEVVAHAIARASRAAPATEED